MAYKEIYDPEGSGQRVGVVTNPVQYHYNNNAPDVQTQPVQQANTAQPVTPQEPVSRKPMIGSGADAVPVQAKSQNVSKNPTPYDAQNIPTARVTTGNTNIQERQAPVTLGTGAAKNAFLNVGPDTSAQINAKNGTQLRNWGNVNGTNNVGADVQPMNVLSGQPSATQQLNAKQGTQIENPTAQDTDTDDNSFEAFRKRMYDEDAIKRESDKRAKIYAVGDALRNLGNLYYTAHDASPQKYSTSPATEERERYETGRQNRDALAYQYYNADLKQKQQQVENAMKKEKNDADIANKNANTKYILQKMGIEAAEFPYDIQSKIADAAYKQAHAGKEEADQAMAELDAMLKKKYGEKEAQLKLAKISSDINQSNASAANSWSQVNYHNAKTKETMQNIYQNGMGNLSFSGYYGTMARPDKKELGDDQVTSIYSTARSKGWIGDDQRYNTFVQNGVDSKHAMIATISDALNEGNPRQRQELTHYLVNNYGFKITNGSRQHQFDYANKSINKQTGHKVGAASESPTKAQKKTTWKDRRKSRATMSGKTTNQSARSKSYSAPRG